MKKRWIVPVLAVINPFSALWIYAFIQVWSHEGWDAVVRAFQ